MQEAVKMVPAVCTQCGAKLEVDPGQDSAVCAYCGASFAVDRAINKYQVEHAHIDRIDHADVKVDLKGATDSVLDFVGKQMSESREMKRERRRLEAENQRSMLKIFAIMMGAMMLFGLVAMVVMNLTDSGGTEETYEERSHDVPYGDPGDNDLLWRLEAGLFYIDEVNPVPGHHWEYEGDHLTTEVEASIEDGDGIHYTIRPTIEDGAAQVILACYPEDSVDAIQYAVYDLQVDRGRFEDEIVDHSMRDSL